MILRGGQVLTPDSGTGAVSAKRTVFYDTNANPTLHVVVTRATSIAVRVVETIPTGFAPASVNHGGVWNSETSTLTWDLAAATGTVLLSYSVAGARGLHSVSGQFFYGSPEAAYNVEGDTQFYIYDLSSGSVSGALTCVRTVVGKDVRLSIAPGSTTAQQTITENIPEGLVVGNIDSGGVWDATVRTITWSFADHAARVVSYSVNGPARVYTFLGSSAVFDTLGVGITGDATLQIGSVGSTPDGSVVYRTFSGEKVQLQIVTPTGTASQKIIEYLPSGITASIISDGGTYSSVDKTLTWIFEDGESRNLSYTVAGAEGVYYFGGVYQMSASTGIIGGDNKLTIGEGLAAGASAVRTVVGTLVYLRIVPASDTTTYKVVETLPASITPTGLSSDGVYDKTTHKITFGPFAGTTARTVQYAVTGAGGTYNLSGLATFNTVEEAVTGASQVKIYDPLTGLDGYKYPQVTGSGPTPPSGQTPSGGTSSGHPATGTPGGLDSPRTGDFVWSGRDTNPSGNSGKGSTEVQYPWATTEPPAGSKPLSLPADRFIITDSSEFSSYA